MGLLCMVLHHRAFLGGGRLEGLGDMKGHKGLGVPGVHSQRGTGGGGSL